ncbi:MAG: hypothetical protein V3R74_06970 [Alphaproteobacteria bacterium]
MKFRIWNYKSIKDSGDCYPTNTVTIFAGKNEAGKTSVLEALEDFNTDREIRSKARPIAEPSELEPTISLTFAVPKEDILEIFKGLSLEPPKNFSNTENLTLIKRIPKNYSFADETVDRLALADEDVPESLSKEIAASCDVLRSLLGQFDAELGAVPFPKFLEDE